MTRNRATRLASAASLIGLAATFAAGAAGPAVRYRPLTPAQLDKVTAPVALYPDLLLAQVLPAAAHPLDVALADQWLRSHPTPTDAEIAAQPWDASVRSLAHYPAAFKLLADNLAWARQLGLAYANQPEDVTRSIQRLRVKARIVGTLKNTPEQSVVAENHFIEIQPAEPEVVYVPVYDPAACFTHPRPPHFEHPRRPAPPAPADPAPTPETPAPVGTSAVRATPPARTLYTGSDDGIRHANTPALATPTPAAPVTPPPPAPPEAPTPPAPPTPAPEALGASPPPRPAAQRQSATAPPPFPASGDRRHATVDR